MKTFLTIVSFLFLFTITVDAQSLNRNKGAGAILGDPTGISLAYWTADSRAFSAAAAWSFRGHESMHIHIDYLFYRFDIITVNTGSLPLYYGLGGRIRFESDDKFGIRFPLGVAYHFQNDPVEIFLEIVPILELIPSTGFTGNAGLGVRYYFGS